MSEPVLTTEERARIRLVFAGVPFVRLLGFQLEEFERGSAVVAAQARPEFLQNRGILHGGFTATLIDSATAFAIIGHLSDGESTSTVDLNIHYLRPVVAGPVAAAARVIRAGRTIITAVAEVTNSDGQLCAMASTTYIRLARQVT
ncbi:MAG: PaaI family thioesterase [Pyrinomonadaceae bacterium]